MTARCSGLQCGVDLATGRRDQHSWHSSVPGGTIVGAWPARAQCSSGPGPWPARYEDSLVESPHHIAAVRLLLGWRNTGRVRVLATLTAGSIDGQPRPWAPSRRRTRGRGLFVLGVLSLRGELADLLADGDAGRPELPEVLLRIRHSPLSVILISAAACFWVQR